MRKVFLDDLPRWGNYGHIDWEKSIGYKVKFIYDDIEGEIEIINHNGNYIYIKYLNKEPYRIISGHFRECKLGNLLGKFTNEFKIELGITFEDDKRNLTIIDREYRSKIIKDVIIQTLKWYKYKCNKCGCDNNWVDESSLIQGVGCSVCCPTPRTIVEGINDIPTTAPWMVKYFQGGYDESKLYTKNSGKKIYPVCPDCGRVKTKLLGIQDIYMGHSIGCTCGDGVSYPNKFMFSLLEQAQVKFETEYSPNWIKPKRFDFYFELNSKKYIVEMDGEFHIKDNGISGQTKEKSKEIDEYKSKLAEENGIIVIRIDSLISELEYIKNNIIHSKLNDLINLKDVDWLKCEEFSLKNLVKIACNYKMINPDISTDEIGNILKLSRSTIISYLKNGTKLGWCLYDAKEENRKRNIRGGKGSAKKNGKIVEIFKDKLSLGIFDNCYDLSRQSEEIFKIKLLPSQISEVSRGDKLIYKGFTFKYVT